LRRDPEHDVFGTLLLIGKHFTLEALIFRLILAAPTVPRSGDKKRRD